MKSRDYNLKTGPNKPTYRDRVDKPDEIAMHHVGDTIEVSYIDEDGIPVWTTGKIAYIKGEWMRVNCGRNMVVIKRGESQGTVLTDKDRCTHCGQFLCECKNKKTQTTKAKPMSEIVKIADLDDYEHDQEVSGLEGVVTKVYDTKKGKKGTRKWSFQNFMLKDDDGDEHKCCFVGPEMEQAKGDIIKKRLRITCSNSGDGLKMNVSGDDDQYRTVNITEDATVEILGAGGEPKPKSGGGKGKPAQSTDGKPITMKQRVYALLRAIGLVKKGVEVLADDLPELSGSDMKEIAVSAVIAAQRGEPLPYFGQDADKVENFDQAAAATEEEKQEEEQQEEEEEKPKTKPKTKVDSWEKFIHPVKKVPLEEIPENKLREWAFWALTEDHSDSAKEVKQMVAVFLTMAAQKHWNLDYFVSAKLSAEGYGEDFQDAAVDLACKEKFGHKLSQLTEDDKKELLSDIEEFASLCKEKEKEAESEEKPAKKKKGGIPD